MHSYRRSSVLRGLQPAGGMNLIGKFISNFKDFYNDINAATLTGAIDVVVVRQLDGTYLSSPFHVRFGKIGVLRSREKVVDIEINGEPVDIHMKLGDNGEAYFVHPLGEDVELQEELNLAEARSQDSGYEAEEKGENAAQSLTLRINVNEKMLSMVSDEKESEIGVVSRVPRQDSTKSVRRDIKTQTTQLPTDKDSSSADEVQSKVSKKSGGGEKKTETENKQKTDVEETSKSSRSQKRKRRKQRKNNSSVSSLPVSSNSLSVSKSYGKKKSSGSQSSDASTTSEVADFTSLNSSKDDGVFPMDDVNKTNSVTPDIPQSNSMPTLAEKPVPVMRPSQSDGSVVPPGERRWGELGGEEKAGGSHKEYGINFHPFSDTDISPPPSPNNSRPSTPIKSDTEYEVERERREVEKRSVREWDWTWGQLPTPPVVKHKSQSNGGISSDGALEAPADGTEATPMEGTSADTDNQNGGTTVTSDMQGEEADRSMFSGVLSFMRATKKARHNPQSEGIYLEDLNPADLNPEVAALYFPKYSGVQKSVSAVDIPSGGVVAKEDDLESGNGTSLPNSPQSAGEAIGASIDLGGGETDRHPVFDYKGYHDIAFSLCGRLKECADQEFPEPLFLQNLVTYDDFCDNPSAILTNPDLVVRMGGKYLNWGSAAPQILSLVLFQRPLASSVSDNLMQMLMPRKSEENESKRKSSTRGLSWLWGRRGEVQGEVVEEKKEVVEEQPKEPSQEPEDKDTVEVCAAETQTSFQEPSDSESGKKDQRSLRLTTKQIEQLKLRDGANDIVFSVTTAYQGTTRCKCRLFLWNYDEKIIVSDIDGTITKSDVLGHIMPIIGNDWAQGGVAQLFTKIKNNGYNFLYLSARAIGQAHITREYLQSVVQGDVSLPDGPMLLNPSSLFQAFHSEVIERKSEEFKKSCLLDIQALYPSESNPFYAGYGNRINDVLAYKTVGIPMSRVFTINHKGEVRHEMTQTFQSSYTSLSDIAHHMFPVYSEESLNHGEYSSVRFWKSPLPDYDDEINQLLGQLAGK